ncbi:MAG: radical SAM protein [Chitinophagaceae bacterium]|nr:MAG: radical SAM protein [Chitinophagaceae bacterium]
MAFETQFDLGLDTVLVKVASRCNINCTYCYVYNMGDDNWSHLEKFMTPDTICALCDSLAIIVARQRKCFSIVLHGGEPFLLGEARLRFLLKSLRQTVPEHYPISIQTNGMLITMPILDICSAYKVSVAVSIDGPEEVHNKYRVTHNDLGTFDKVLAGINILKSHPDFKFLYAGLLAVIDPLSDPATVYSFFKELEAPSVDFLYKDGNHSKLPLNKSSIYSVEYGTWMVKLLEIYLNDTQPMKVRVLDDMIKSLLGGVVTKEGLGLTDFAIVIVDTDGTIMKNDTLKSTYNGADKFNQPLNIKDSSLLDFLGSAEFDEYRKMQRPTNAKCLSCSELHVCGGGMILNRWSNEDGFDNPSVYCADQLHLIKAIRKTLFQYNLQYA